MSEFSDHPQIAELLETLEANEMHKEKAEVQSLVEYIGEMETTLSDMLEEMKGMKEEIGKIHDGTLRARCMTLVQKTEGLIKKCIEVLKKAKDNLVQAASRAVNAFKEKGKEAFRKAVHAMKIPETLDKLAGMFGNMAKEAKDNSAQLKAMQAELNVGKAHIRNVGRLLTGKLTKDTESVKTDRGILAGIGKLHDKLAKGFEGLAQKAMDRADKLRTDHVKESVKAELEKLKGITGERAAKEPDIAR